MTLALKAAILAEAERLGFPYCSYRGGSSHLAGEQSWRNRLPDIMAGDLAEIEAGLHAHAAEHERGERVADGLAEIDKQRAERDAPFDPALAEQERREGLEAHERELRRRGDEDPLQYEILTTLREIAALAKR